MPLLAGNRINGIHVFEINLETGQGFLYCIGVGFYAMQPVSFVMFCFQSRAVEADEYMGNGGIFFANVERIGVVIADVFDDKSVAS